MTFCGEFVWTRENGGLDRGFDEFELSCSCVTYTYRCGGGLWVERRGGDGNLKG